MSIISQIGNALHYANQHNILHHDLKPANILLNSKNKVLLTDFGIAIVQINTTVNHPAASTGTPLYMAPEQFLGRVGPKSDQYSLSCIAYELVTGRPPFLAPNAVALAYMHLHEEPTPPRLFNTDLPLHIEQAILKALEKQTINRHDDISAFVKALNTSTSQVPPPIIPTIFRRTAQQQLNEVLRLSNLNRYQEALAACDQALKLNPNYVAAYKTKGFLLSKLNLYQDALDVYKQVTYLAPKDSDGWKRKGDILYRLKDYKEAFAAFARASHLDPEDPSNYYNIAHVLKLLGWLEEAQRAHEKAHQLSLKKQ